MFCRCIRLALSANNTHFLKNFHAIQVSRTEGYKSKLSLENLYPGSASSSAFEHSYSINSKEEEQFSGFIPTEKIDFTFTRSSGGGGQNVNKVSTKVNARFHLQSATWIPDWIKEKVQEQQKYHINKEGYLMVSSEKTRKQVLNKADCMDQIRSMIYKGAVKPKEQSPQELARIAKGKGKFQREVLRKKRMHSEKKKFRYDP
ncbi:peptidyl-tRNA hydrolase ICT1, mitochondrial-like isoform X2 [Pecten maximus]|uniref:peptidyl-tRNA hydrolase ICT1, mitochondrial-like isoform X2 n=1 Tax=Pecten maximus TaxID=6579 RepID=UPI001458C512|nr:peptidyl-tRNA hydrolase ICT1, mitochondrial-like isoform X2 [Pecten maximus]